MFSKARFKTFIRDSRANTAIVFALSAIPMVIIAGGVIDLVSAHSTKSKLQKAVDSAALAAAAAAQISDSEAKAVGLKAFALNFAGNGAEQYVTSPDVTVTDEQVVATATTHRPTTFLKMIGINTMDVFVKAVAKRGSGGALEIALVLDNTKSMDHDNKIDDLKTAASELVSTLSSKTKKNNPKIALVPYATYVNIGTDRRGEPWLDVPPDTPGEYSCHQVPDYDPNNCWTETGTSWQDGSTETYTYTQCQQIGSHEECSTSGEITWHGCVGSREYPTNIDNSTVNGNKIKGVSGPWCQRPLVSLTDDEPLLQDEISKMSTGANGTYIPVGLMWGWRALSKNEPLTEATSKTYAKKNHIAKVLVLMTDGMNTCVKGHSENPLSLSNREHWCGESHEHEADSLTVELCTNIKNDGITIFTVAFKVPDQAAKDVLKSCASDADKFYDATDSAKLASAFQSIAASLSQVYLAE